MIFVGLLIIGLVFYGFCSFWGFVIAATAKFMSDKYKSGALPQKYAEPPSHVNLLIPPQPYDQAKNLAGWDGAEELDIEEDL